MRAVGPDITPWTPNIVVQGREKEEGRKERDILEADPGAGNRKWPGHRKW